MANLLVYTARANKNLNVARLNTGAAMPPNRLKMQILGNLLNQGANGLLIVSQRDPHHHVELLLPRRPLNALEQSKLSSHNVNVAYPAAISPPLQKKATPSNLTAGLSSARIPKGTVLYHAPALENPAPLQSFRSNRVNRSKTTFWALRNMEPFIRYQEELQLNERHAKLSSRSSGSNGSRPAKRSKKKKGSSSRSQ